MASARESHLAKYQQIYDTLVREIQGGQWPAGTQLPSEAALVKRFKASRITVGRAVRELHAAGLVDRRAGSGTYVKAPAAVPQGLSFGLLIPDLGDADVFTSICHGMMSSPLARDHALVWGSLPDDDRPTEQRVWDLCQQFIARRVAGVFFAPLDLTSERDNVNRRITRALADAGIPVVLIDRGIAPFGGREEHDVVGIDHRQAGYVVTEHLLRLARRRIAFVAPPGAGATADAREAGYREALFTWNAPVEAGLLKRFDPAEDETVRALMTIVKPEAIVGVNDRTAGQVMHSLMRLGYRVPDAVRVVGMDDVEYASLVATPLTTYRQPTRAIGDAALSAMLQRVARVDLAPRQILLQGELVVRTSCGASRARVQVSAS